MIKLECKNGIVEVEMNGTPDQLADELAITILAVNNRFNQRSPIPIKNHFWVAVSELVNETLMEESER